MSHLTVAKGRLSLDRGSAEGGADLRNPILIGLFTHLVFVRAGELETRMGVCLHCGVGLLF
jgi:hypothetical protein